MREIKVLNLYACLGGNRLKWTDCEVTAVEIDNELCQLYQERFPNDTVICADAHEYLLRHYKEFDFIWSSPPCPTHSRIRMTQRDRFEAVFPEMTLYQEIIFLQHYFKGKFCVENVIPFYEPLIAAQKRGRHLYWTNFNLPAKLSNRTVLIGKGKDEFKNLCDFHDYDFKQYKGVQNTCKIARNLVDYEAGRVIFETAKNIILGNKNEKQSLFA
jgi:DNA (cytosine-5)-methyltransferase 1